MVNTRAQTLASAPKCLFADLPADVWDNICEHLGFQGVVAERTSHSLRQNLRDSRVCLKLPNMYACRFNGVIRGQVEGRPHSGRYDSELYASLLIEIVERYPDLQVSPLCDGCTVPPAALPPYSRGEVSLCRVSPPCRSLTRPRSGRATCRLATTIRG